MRIFGNPKIRIFGNPKIRISEHPDFRISESPECWNSESPDFPDFAVSENPDFRITDTESMPRVIIFNYRYRFPFFGVISVMCFCGWYRSQEYCAYGHRCLNMFRQVRTSCQCHVPTSPEECGPVATTRTGNLQSRLGNQTTAKKSIEHGLIWHDAINTPGILLAKWPFTC